MVTCKRCGLCCYYIIDGKLKKCKHLVTLKSGSKVCRIYPRRLGKVLDVKDNGQKVMCMLRKNSYYDYEGCPYNTDKPMFGGDKK